MLVVIESQNIIAELGAMSYIGIWFVSLLSNIVIPVPEEIVLLALGYIAGTGQVSIIILLPLIISGLLLSDIIMYLLSKKGSRFVTWLYNKFFSKKLEHKSQGWFDTHINKIVFFSRFLIQLRFIGPFVAGQKKMPIKNFIKYDMAALVIYVPLYVLLGLFFHNRVKSIVENVGVVRNIVLVFFGVLAAYIIFKATFRYLLKGSSETEPTN